MELAEKEEREGWELARSDGSTAKGNTGRAVIVIVFIFLFVLIYSLMNTYTDEYSAFFTNDYSICTQGDSGNPGSNGVNGQSGNSGNPGSPGEDGKNGLSNSAVTDM